MRIAVDDEVKLINRWFRAARASVMTWEPAPMPEGYTPHGRIVSPKTQTRRSI